MKTFEVHRIKKLVNTNCTEKLADETQTFLNQKANEGYELVNVSFHLENDMGYIYSYIVLQK